MTDSTYATLLQVFPTLVLAGIVENARVHPRIRVRAWYRWLVLTELASGAIGITLCFLGMNAQGFGNLAISGAVATTICFVVLLVVLFWQLIAIVATQEQEIEDAERAEAAQPHRGRAALLRAFLRGRLD